MQVGECVPLLEACSMALSTKSHFGKVNTFYFHVILVTV